MLKRLSEEGSRGMGCIGRSSRKQPGHRFGSKAETSKSRLGRGERLSEAEEVSLGHVS